METRYKDYYKSQLEEAHAFQDYCANIFLTQLGIAVTNYKSKEYQFARGENVQGIEIKYDKLFHKTGNIYIEVQEKSDPNNSDYVDSGIYRLDNSWLYAIGDYKTIYIFAKTLLSLLHKSNKFKVATTPTSIGFLLPLEDADKYCAKKFQPDHEDL